MREFAEQVNSFGLEGLRKSFDSLQQRGGYPKQLTCNAQKQNKTKCRYNGKVFFK